MAYGRIMANQAQRRSAGSISYADARAVHERVAAIQAEILLLAATQDVDRIAASGGGAGDVEIRLAEMDLHLLGRISEGAGTIAEQVVLWYARHDRDQARGLVRDAVREHASAALAKLANGAGRSGRGTSSILDAELLGAS